jgi:hypothetical protein
VPVVPVTPPVHSVTLTWGASVNCNPCTYNVYRGAATGGPYTKIGSVQTQPAYDDQAVTAGETLFYVVTAYLPCPAALICGESNYSNEVKAAIPSP